MVLKNDIQGEWTKRISIIEVIATENQNQNYKSNTELNHYPLRLLRETTAYRLRGDLDREDGRDLLKIETSIMEIINLISLFLPP